MYKAKCDGLQTYDIFKKGYIYEIFMCNDPSPKKNLAKKMLQLHARVMAFFDTMEEKHHQCAMYNLYNSDCFFQDSVQSREKLLSRGVTRKGMRGILSRVTQEELK